MAAINFPPSPTENDTHTENGKTWIFNDPVWNIVESSSTSKNEQAGDYELVLSDQYKTIHMTGGSANQLTIPLDVLPVGVRIPGWTMGAGDTTFVAETGVTLNSRGDAFTSAGQYAAWFLEQVAENEWVLTGDLTA